MRLRRFILASLAALVAFVSCEDLENLGLPTIKLDGDGTMAFEIAGGDQQITLTATRDWWIECDADWLDFLPKEGKASADAQTITITAKANGGMDRIADVKFSIGMSFQTLTVTQTGPGGSLEDLTVYANDFDKELATQTYGTTGDRWPYLDQFDGWKNEKGTGIADVEYVAGGMSARNNANSDGSYSDYDGSGNNNLLFSTNNYFAIKNIALGESRNYTVSFGTEKYAGEGDNTFVPSEFHVYISADASKWVELTYAFPGEFKNGRWDLASSTFTLPADVNTLHMYFKSDLAGGHRIDDLKLLVSTAAGTAIDFSTGIDMEVGGSGGGNTGGGQEPDATAIYHNTYDKEAATKTYGSGSSWPYLDQFDGWMNAVGTGAENVTYAYKGISARNNSNSNGEHSNYAGSGVNNIFFGKDAYFATRNIALGGTTNLTLTFGTEKYSSENGSVFKNSEYHIWLSNDGGAKWVEFTDYTFAGGTTEGKWNVATANLTVPSGTETLSICMAVDVASSYRMDDLKLVAAEAAGTAVDFTNAVEKDFGEGGEVTPPSGGDEPEPAPEVSAIADILTAEEGDAVAASGTVMAVTTKGFLLQDATGILYVYTNGDTEVAVGNNVTASGKFDNYFGTLQIGGPATVTANDKATAAPTYPDLTDLTDQAAYDAFKTYSETNPVDYPYVKVKGVLSDGRYITVGTSDKQSMIYYSASDYSGNNGKTVTVTGYIVGFHSTNGYYQLVETNVEVDQNSGNDDGGDTPGDDVTPPAGGDDPAPSEGSWAKVTSLTDLTAGKYVVVFKHDDDGKYYAMTNASASKNPSGIEVTVEGAAISGNVDASVQWTFTGDNEAGFSISAGDNYLNSKDDSQGISISTTSTCKWYVTEDASNGYLLQRKDTEIARYLAAYRNSSGVVTFRYYNVGASYKGELMFFKQAE